MLNERHLSALSLLLILLLTDLLLTDAASQSATPLEINKALAENSNVKEFGEGIYDLSDCKTLIVFCNGMWCDQSPNNIKNLVKLGYPLHKIKWYRGGMQAWKILSFNSAQPVQ